MRRGDLLGCICLIGAHCSRNCRIENEQFLVPPAASMRTLSFDPKGNNDLVNLAWERVEQEENEENIVALEAWSNGTIHIWTEKEEVDEGPF